ncbi:MAG: cyclic nucleotide-binding domain-containing protein [Pseudomonadota bacterium]
MDAFIAEFDVKSLLIAGAVGSYVLGFLFRDQIYTRLLVMVGSSMYIVYYGTVGPTPLWDAIVGSVLIGLSSAQGVIRLWLSRMVWVVPKEARDIYGRMGQIEPGLFRQLYRAADRAKARKDVVLTRQGEAVDRLWYLVGGTLQVEREGQEAAMISQSGFVGEIAWLTNGAATATVTAREGAEILSWPTKKLRGATRKSVRLELALDSLIAQDLARKLSKSHPIEVATQAERAVTSVPNAPGRDFIAAVRP